MMRIIAGRLGGRTFDAPSNSSTHPMGDKVRGALFNILGDIEGLHVLDAFAGSGALSYEALSRGAATAVALENDHTAYQTIIKNRHALALTDQLHVHKLSGQAWLQAYPEVHFDLVLCDPPYDNTQVQLLQQLAARIADNGVLAVSWPTGSEAPEFPGLKKVAHRSYGDAQLLFFTHNS